MAPPVVAAWHPTNVQSTIVVVERTSVPQLGQSGAKALRQQASQDRRQKGIIVRMTIRTQKVKRRLVCHILDDMEKPFYSRIQNR
jgi:hypothetical protein